MRIAVPGVAAARRLADPAIQTRGRRFLALAYIRLGRFDEAHTSSCTTPWTLPSASATGPGKPRTHHSLASLWARRSQPAQALPHAVQALHLYQATGHQNGQASAINTVGWYHATGNPQTARDTWQQALTILDDLDHPDAAQVRARLASCDPPTGQATH